MKRLILERKLGLISLLVNILAGLYFLQPLLVVASDPAHILFVERNCAFCTITSREIVQKNYQKEFKVTTMDISESKFYENHFHSVITKCSFNEDQVGVPLLFSQQKRYLGVKDTLQELERLSVVK